MRKLFYSCGLSSENMTKITVEYFQNIPTDFSSPSASAVVRLSPNNKWPISFLEKKFQLTTVEEIEDGVAVGIGFDEHGDSRNEYTPNSTIHITGEPKGIVQWFYLIS
jgi:hypothetical protein